MLVPSVWFMLLRFDVSVKFFCQDILETTTLDMKVFYSVSLHVVLLRDSLVLGIDHKIQWTEEGRQGGPKKARGGEKERQSRHLEQKRTLEREKESEIPKEDESKGKARHSIRLRGQNKTLAPYTQPQREPVSELSTTWGNQHGGEGSGGAEGGRRCP